MFLNVILLVIALAITCAVLYEKNSSYAIENRKLKKRIEELEQTSIPRDSKVVEPQKSVAETTTHTEAEVSSKAEVSSEKQTEKTEVEVPKKSEEEIRREKLEKARLEEKKELEKRNTTIMATGAILVIIATIVFLSSTWNILSNGVKVVGLLLFLGIFYGASKIAKDKFNLENTSKTFFYLAMAYVPICFLSLSFFELVGKRFSVNGELFKHYLFTSTIITSVIYAYFYVVRRNKVLFYGSIIAQATSMVLLALVLGGEVDLAILLVLAYTLLLGTVLRGEAKQMVKYLIYAAVAVEAIVSIEFAFDERWTAIGIYALLAANFLMILLNYNKSNVVSFLFNAFLYATGFHFSFIFLESLSIDLKVIMSIVYFIFAYMLEGLLINGNTEYNGLKKSSSIVNLCSYFILYWIVDIKECDFIMPYMIAIIGEAFLLFEYFKCEEGILRKIIGYAIPIVIIVILLELVKYIPFVNYVYVALVVLLIGEIFRKTKYHDLCDGFMVVTLVYAFLAYGKMSATKTDDTIINRIILTLIYVYYWFKTQKMPLKYLMYLAVGAFLCRDYEIPMLCNLNAIALAILSLGIIACEMFYPKMKDRFSNPFLAVVIVLAYLAIIGIKAEVEILIGLVYSILVYAYMMSGAMDKNYRLIPLLGLFYILTLAEVGSMMMIWRIIYTVALVLIAAYEGNISFETLLSGCMLIGFIRPDIGNDVVAAAFIVIWSVINLMIAREEKPKDLFKAITIFSVLYLYISAIKWLGFTTYNSIYYIGATIALALVVEIVLNKYFKQDINVIRAGIHAILYIVAFLNYNGEIDGIIFVVFLLLYALLMFKNSKSNVFKVNIITILINAIILTRSFWLSLPWWIYLLVAGAALIGFAVVNESKSTKRKTIENKTMEKKIEDSVSEKVSVGVNMGAIEGNEVENNNGNNDGINDNGNNE